MQTKQKEIVTLDGIFYSLAARFMCRGLSGKEAEAAAKQKLSVGAKTALRHAAFAAAGLCAGGGVSFGGASPFAAGLLCAQDEKLPTVTLGVFIGCLLRGDFLLASSAMLLAFARFIALRFISAESVRVRIIEAVSAAAFHGLLRMITDAIDATTLLSSAFEISAAGALAFFFGALFCEDKRYTAAYESGLFLALYGLACALARIKFFGASPLFLVGIIVVSWTARMGGGARGCVAGLLWGLAGKAIYAPALAIAGLVCGRAPSLISGVGGGALLAMIYAGFTGGFSAVREFMPETALGAILYAPLYKWRLLPDIDVFGRGCVCPPGEQKEDNDTRTDQIQQRLDAAAGALQAMSVIMNGNGKERAGQCIGADDAKSMALLIRSTLDGQEEDQSDPELAVKCRRALSATNFRCGSLICTGSRQKTLTARAVKGPYMNIDPDSITRRLNNLTGENFGTPEFETDGKLAKMTIRTMPRLSPSFCARSVKKRGEKVCGDAFTSFYSRDGRYYAILCDGMGSGSDAAAAARICCVFLEKMLEGGNECEAALDMLNSFLRGKGYECFATVDILSVDLYTKSAFVIKGGGAPSYLLRSGKIYTLCAPSAPVGIIRELRAQKISFDVREGDTLLLVSDGIADADSPLEAEHLLREPRPHTPDEFADRVMCLSRVRGRDDATVCAVNIKEEA